jgi:hypothetical protein
MDIFQSGFLAQIPYLEGKIAKTLKISTWGHFGRILHFLIFFYSKKYCLKKNLMKKLFLT